MSALTRLLACSALFLPVTGLAAQVRVWTALAEERIAREAAPRDLQPVEIHAARNERESFQIVVGGAPQPAMLSLEPFTGGAKIGASIFREHFVRVSVPSPHSPLGAGEYADALVPNGMSLPAGAPFSGNQIFWIDLAIARDSAAGTVASTVVVKTESAAVRVPLVVHIWPVTIPDRVPLRSSIGASWRRIAQLHRLPEKASSAATEQMTMAYHRLLAEHRLCPAEPFPLEPEVDADGRLTRFPEAACRRHFDELHFNTLRIPLWPDWPFADPLGANKPAAQRYVSEFMAQLKARQWHPFACLHCAIDEPDTPAEFEAVSRWRDFSAGAQGVPFPFAVTTPPVKSAAEVTGIHATLYADLWRDLREGGPGLTRRHAANIWSYAAMVQFPDEFLAAHSGRNTRLIDRHPPVWLIDFSPMNYRLAGWHCAANGWPGLLYWEALHFDRGVDPWRDAGTFQTENLTFNGDGLLVYSAKSGPLPSLRLKWLRDSVEDHALLTLAAQSGHRAAAAEAFRSVVPGLTGWSADPAPMLNARRRLGEAMSK